MEIESDFVFELNKNMSLSGPYLVLVYSLFIDINIKI